MDKRFFGIIIVIIAVFVGIGVFTNNKKEDTKGTSLASNHTIGGKDAKVTLIEYGDYQCPACEQYYPVLNQVKEFYGDKLKFQFRNYPLTSLHPNAYAAARAGEAANLQGKFWEMHDALYEQSNWQVWSDSTNARPLFDSYATKLGLNLEKFRKDFSSSKVNDIIRADMAEGNKIKVTSTPTFVLNGKKVENVGVSLDAFKAIIDPEIAKAEKN